MFLNEGTGLISYGRFDGHNIMIAAFNNNEYDMTVSIPVWRCGAENGKKFNVVFNSNGDESENMYLTDNGKIDVFIKSLQRSVIKLWILKYYTKTIILLLWKKNVVFRRSRIKPVMKI